MSWTITTTANEALAMAPAHPYIVPFSSQQDGATNQGLYVESATWLLKCHWGSFPTLSPSSPGLTLTFTNHH